MEMISKIKINGVEYELQPAVEAKEAAETAKASATEAKEAAEVASEMVENMYASMEVPTDGYITKDKVYLASSGTLNNSSGLNFVKIPCVAGDVYTINYDNSIMANISCTPCFVVGENGKYIQEIFPTRASITSGDVEFTIADGGVFIVAHYEAISPEAPTICRHNISPIDYVDAMLTVEQNQRVEADKSIPLSQEEKDFMRFFKGYGTETYYEEYRGNLKVYLKIEDLRVRGYANGVYVSKNYTTALIAEDCGLSLVTSIKGVEGCLCLGDEFTLYYDLDLLKFQYIHRKNVHNDNTKIPIMFSEGGTLAYCIPSLIPHIFSNDAEAEAKSEDSILARNKDVEHIINAAARYGWHAGGKTNPYKQFTMLVTTDVHKCEDRLNDAIEYLNAMGAIDCGICVGDMASGYYNDTDGTWYSKIVAKSNKPFLTAIGNHDMGNNSNVGQSATVAQAVGKWITPNVSKIGDTSINKSYYFKDFSTYKVRVIVLNSYDAPDTLAGDGTFLVSRSVECYSQEQIDWFVNTLLNTPVDYHVLICSHFSASQATRDSSINFNHYYKDFPTRDPQGGVIADIMNAYTNGTSVSGTYNGLADGVPSVTVNTNFSNHGKGVLIGYLSGHLHWDCVGHITKYSSQKAFAFSATADDKYQNETDDLPRASGTKAMDALTTITVSTGDRKLYITRVGADTTWSWKRREPTVISY